MKYANEIERGKAFYRASTKTFLTNDQSNLAGFESDLVSLYVQVGVLADRFLVTPEQMRRYFASLEFVCGEFDKSRKPSPNDNRTFNVCLQTLAGIARFSTELRLTRTFARECARIVKSKRLIDMDDETLNQIALQSHAVIFDLRDQGRFNPSLILEFSTCVDSFLILALAFTSGEYPIIKSLKAIYEHEGDAQDASDFLIGMWKAATGEEAGERTLS